MNVLTIANNKGGQGKTTLSVFISQYLARKGKRVLAVDLDPQCNFSQRFLEMEFDENDPEIIRPPLNPDIGEDEAPWDGRASSADVFLYEAAVSYTTPYENIEILPGQSKDLLRVERVSEDEVKRAVHEIFARWLHEAHLETDYDVVVIDTGPSKGPLTTAAIYAATDILIPAEMEEMAVEGLYGMLAYWNMANLQRPAESPINLLGILANKIQTRNSIHQHFYEVLCEDPTVGQYMLPQVMHAWNGYREATMHGAKSIFDAPPSTNARQEAEAVCQLIEERMSHGKAIEA